MIKKGIRTNHRVPFYLRDKMGSMKKRAFYLCFAMAFAICCKLQVCAQNKSNLDPFAKCLQLPPKYVRLEKQAKSNKAKLWLTVKLPCNFECCIDWGDGVIEQREAPLRKAGVAPQTKATTKSISHTYKKKGTYKVRLKTNNDEPQKKARDVLYYEAII